VTLEAIFKYQKVEVNGRLCRVWWDLLLFLQGQSKSGDAPGLGCGFAQEGCSWRMGKRSRTLKKGNSLHQDKFRVVCEQVVGRCAAFLS
jgi:hypothetical protein